MDEKGLRSLAKEIQEISEKHPCYHQVRFIVSVCVDHINSIAAVGERNAEVMRLLKNERID